MCCTHQNTTQYIHSFIHSLIHSLHCIEVHCNKKDPTVIIVHKWLMMSTVTTVLQISGVSIICKLTLNNARAVTAAFYRSDTSEQKIIQVNCTTLQHCQPTRLKSP